MQKVMVENNAGAGYVDSALNSPAVSCTVTVIPLIPGGVPD
jgi:hypothetical protein